MAVLKVWLQEANAMETTMERPALLENHHRIENSRLSARERAEETIAELLILNEDGLSLEQVEAFIRACAVLRS
jgi:hypothetical protein